MISYLYQYTRDIRALFRGNKPTSKLKLFLLYNWLCAKNVVLTKILKTHPKKQKILGYTVLFDNFNSFFAMFSEIFIHGVYETKISEKTPTIVDCGANIGLSVLYFKKVFPHSKVLAFEPDPRTFRLLEKNIKNNQLVDVQLFNKAVGEKKEKLTLYSFNDFEGGPGNTIDAKYISFKNKKEFEVEVLPISSLNLEKIDILKIDVEGAESFIFKDLVKNNLLEKVKVLHLEYHYNYETDQNKLSYIIQSLEQSKFNYMINPDTLINDLVTLDECLKLKRYVLIITGYH